MSLITFIGVVTEGALSRRVFSSSDCIFLLLLGGAISAVAGTCYAYVGGGANVRGRRRLMTYACHAVSHAATKCLVLHRLGVGGRPVRQSVQRLAELRAYL